ncbi:MAG: hypothetical protein A2145_05955 [candidate division Zixibacteria bacterium RBG_16_40_9]|nr:MAG: hypothetical protein A2145_05955 [candidate division Zixibacteria bacterium RBG_16_40_9]
MMKRLLILSIALSMWWFFSHSTLQAYEVETGTIGNTYALKVKNQGTDTLKGVTVTMHSSPSWVLNFSPTYNNLGEILPSDSATANFTFDVAPGLDSLDSLDGELEFQITTSSGKLWKKYLLLYVVTRLVNTNPQSDGACCNGSQYDLYTPGDANGDEKISLSDIIYLINYVFKNGPEPIPFFLAGDMNEDGLVNLADIMALVNYIFRSP